MNYMIINIKEIDQLFIRLVTGKKWINLIKNLHKLCIIRLFSILKVFFLLRIHQGLLAVSSKT